MTEKKVSEAIEFRRSVRIFDSEKDINSDLVKKCIEQAVLAPNSSNLQLWEFYHVKTRKIMNQTARACFNQPAAKTAKQFVIPVVRKDLWKRRINSNIEFVKSEFEKQNKRDPRKEKKTLEYFTNTLPKNFTDRIGLIGLYNFFKVQIIGTKKVVNRQVLKSDMRIVAHKSIALAAQNFVISMAGYGYDTCTMEGFDSLKLKKILKLPRKTEISMVIGCGIRTNRGIYGPRFRVPLDEIYFEK